MNIPGISLSPGKTQNFGFGALQAQEAPAVALAKQETGVAAGPGAPIPPVLDDTLAENKKHTDLLTTIASALTSTAMRGNSMYQTDRSTAIGAS